MTARRRPPLVVYVVWHPRCQDGPLLARTLYDWLSASTDDLRWSGCGIPVRYATSAAEPPDAIDLEVADRVVAVHLIDEHWVADRPWRDHLDAAFSAVVDGERRTYALEPPEDEERRAHERATRARLLALPAMLHRSAMNLRGLRTPMVLDPPQPKGDRLSARKERLRRRVTQAMGRWLLASAASPGALTAHETDPEMGARPTVFISHAKADGAELGRQLREEIINYGQLRPFFDENDLPYGADWRLRLANATVNVSAMVAILTDAYASRPWCRTELLAARRPHREAQRAVWSIRPVAAIERLEKHFTSFLPELGNVPVIRWQPDVAAMVLDRLVLQMLLTEYHAQIARGLADHGVNAASEAGRGALPQRHFVTWVPDVITVAHLLGEAGVGERTAVELVYPGHGLRTSERAKLESLFGSYPVRLRTYDEVAGPASTRPLAGAGMPAQGNDFRPQPVAVSASYSPTPDLHRRGLGPEHFHELVVRLGRSLLDRGFALAYGGSPPRTPPLPTVAAMPPGASDVTPGAAADRAVPRPSVATENFTTTLRELARDERLLDAAIDGLPREGYRPLFHSYLAPASAAELDSEHIADDHGLCAYVRLERSAARPGDPKGLWQSGDTLSRVREAMVRHHHDVDGESVPPCCARVIVGGASDNFGGVLPGIAEEALYTLEAGIPLYVIGGFGGAAAAIAETLETGTLAPSLSFEALQATERVRSTYDAYEWALATPTPAELHARLCTALAGPVPANGLDDDENRRLRGSRDALEIIGLIEKGLAAIIDSQRGDTSRAPTHTNGG